MGIIKGMRYRLILLIIFLSQSYCGYAGLTLSSEESAVLRQFFRALTQESEAGYVFFNKKPVCIDGYFYKDVFAVNSPAHKQSVALRAGAYIWKQLVDKNSDITVHICDKEDPGIPGYIHVLVVNVPLFHRIINENLSLFQHVLGPAVTSNNLLDALISNSQTFHSLLKDDKVLIGEILGFGIQNSLYVSRMENIQEAFETNIPPFLHCESIVQQYEHEYLPFPPSFGFKSANAELNNFQEKVTLSSEKLTQKNPEFIFGWLKDSKKEQNFVSDLENTQVKIQTFLKSPSFLEKTLEMLTGKQFQIAKKQEFQFQFGKDRINKLVARGLWESIQNYDKEFLSYFIKGMENPNISCSEIPRLAYFPGYRREVIGAKNNLERTADLFRSFEKEQNVTCIIPQMLYYKTLKRSHNKIECIGPLVSLEFSIFSPLGHCLNYQPNRLVNLKNTIPGFAHGVKGMKVGETREIFIHPSLGYGFETSLDKCISLRAIVTLLESHESHDAFLPVESIDLSFLLDENTLIERTENYKAVLIDKGKQISDHLKKNPQVDLVSVCEHLKNFQSNPEEFVPTTDEEQALINQVHWNIYFGRDSAN